MITKFKIFENESKPAPNDWVVLDVNKMVTFSDFIDNNIGQIIHIIAKGNGIYMVDYYKKIPGMDRTYVMVNSSQIIFHSSNREDCEAYLASKKYNI